METNATAPAWTPIKIGLNTIISADPSIHDPTPTLNPADTNKKLHLDKVMKHTSLGFKVYSMYIKQGHDQKS